jgi:hypothetical protein
VNSRSIKPGVCYVCGLDTRTAHDRHEVPFPTMQVNGVEVRAHPMCIARYEAAFRPITARAITRDDGSPRFRYNDAGDDDA